MVPDLVVISVVWLFVGGMLLLPFVVMTGLLVRRLLPQGGVRKPPADVSGS